MTTPGPTPGETPPAPPDPLESLLRVGQEWVDEDGDALVIVSLDFGTVQYQYDAGGTLGRNSVAGFRDRRPAQLHRYRRPAARQRLYRRRR